jgi:hypothetical protein
MLAGAIQYSSVLAFSARGVNMNNQYKGFVSEIDQLLLTFDTQHPELSESQKKEKAKHEHIYRQPNTLNGSHASSLILDDWF